MIVVGIVAVFVIGGSVMAWALCQTAAKGNDQ